MAEALVQTMKHDCVRVAEKPNAKAVIDQLPRWLRAITAPSASMAPFAA